MTRGTEGRTKRSLRGNSGRYYVNTNFQGELQAIFAAKLFWGGFGFGDSPLWP